MAQTGPFPCYTNYAAPVGPTAGQTLVSLTVTPGTYVVLVEELFTGTVTAAEQNNIQLNSDPEVAGSMVPQGIKLTIQSAQGSSSVMLPRRYIVNALSTISLTAPNAGGVAAAYNVTIAAMQDNNAHL